MRYSLIRPRNELFNGTSKSECWDVTQVLPGVKYYFNSAETAYRIILNIYYLSAVSFTIHFPFQEFLIYGSHSKPEFLYRQVHTVLGERFMGSGLVTEHVSSLWEAKRSLFNPAFHRR